MLNKSFQSTMNNYVSMISFVREFLETTDLDNKKKKQFELALEEALLNIIHYAYQGNDGNLEIQALLENESKTVSFILIDSGIPFNPCTSKEKKLPVSIDEEELGNLGIFLIKKMCDNCKYEHKDKRNILKLSKSI